MKKFLALILALVMVFALAACGDAGDTGDGSSSGDTVELILSCNGTEQGNDTRAARRFAELLSERSDGRLKVTVYNNDQLAGGDMTKGLELLTSGSVDFDVHSTSIISSLAPSAMVATLPWLFADYQAAEDCFFGTGGEYMNKILGESGVTYLGAVHNGFNLMTNSKHPIQHPEDLQGLKIRIPGGDFFMDFYSAYGASPQAMSWSEVFTALQQGAVDAEENPLAVITANRLYEVQNTVTLTGHFYTAGIFNINKDFYESLEGQDKEWFDEASEHYVQNLTQLIRDAQEGYIQLLKDNGINVVEVTSEQKDAFIESAASVYDLFIEKYGGTQELIDLAMKYNDDF